MVQQIGAQSEAALRVAALRLAPMQQLAKRLGDPVISSTCMCICICRAKRLGHPVIGSTSNCKMVIIAVILIMIYDYY